jgi:hypothetical protein
MTSASTVRYRFEHRLHDWATSWVQRLCGRTCGFFVGFREDGSVRRVYLAHPERELSGDEKQALVQRYTSWFLFHPYDDREGGYLEWFALPQSQVETWLGRSLDATDFIDVRETGSREDWPESWRVIVG